MLTSNIIPVVLGNAVAGVLCMALPYALIYGNLGQKLQAMFARKSALAA